MATSIRYIVAIRKVKSESQRNTGIHRIIAVFSILFFILGTITVSFNLLIPQLKDIYKISDNDTLYLIFAFFIPYFFLGVPASWLIQKIGLKKSIILGLILGSSGSLISYGSTQFHEFSLLLFSTFILGLSLALLFVSATTIFATIGPSETTAGKFNIAAIFYSLFALIIYLFGAELFQLEYIQDTHVQEYCLILAIVLLVLVLIVNNTKISVLEKIGIRDYGRALHFRNLKLGIFAVFFTVGAEISIATFLKEYLMLDYVFGMSGDKAEEIVLIYWIGSMAGKIFGISFLNNIGTNKVLSLISIVAVILIFFGVNSPHYIAVWTFVLIGLFNSIMLPCIFSLAIKDLGKYISGGSAYLMIGFAGGVIVPLLQGYMAAGTSVQVSFIVAGLCYGYLIFYSLSGYKASVL